MLGKRVGGILFRPSRIISGGQTGVDRGALEAAIALGVEHGGWCPRGRLAEDGSIPSRYALSELDSVDYAARTEQNVIDSDGTLILYKQKLRGGTLLTLRLAQRWGRPVQTVDLNTEWQVETVRHWLDSVRPETLNVAGPRESSSPGIETLAMEAILQILA